MPDRLDQAEGRSESGEVVINPGEPEHTIVRFDDRSYRWIDLKCFPWDGMGEDRAVLARLIASRYYRDSYLAPDSHEQDAETVHGPYQIAGISSDDFEPLAPSEARAIVEEFCNLDGSPPVPGVTREVESLILPRLQASACYRLPHLPLAEHDAAFALWEFRELVALSREAGAVTLIVMAID